MNTLFQDLIKLYISPLFCSPFDSDITDFPLIIQDNIIEIQCNNKKQKLKILVMFHFG